MPMTLDQLTGAIRDRGQFTGAGIGFASGYLDTLVGGLGKSGLAGHLKITRDALDTAIKSAGMKLVYRDPGAEITAAVVRGEDGLAFQGKSARPDAEFKTIKQTSLMEFENVLTTDGTDRDGDTLAPKGAEVDPSAPLLWQHLPDAPIGKMFKVLDQNDKFVKTYCGIADTPLGHDAAVLVDYGALRISHGFKPKEWEPKNQKDSGEDGFNIYKYEVMEVSLVSIPANVGAVITALEKGKLGTALVKSFAGALNAGRTKCLTGGWDKTAAAKTTDTTTGAAGVTVNVNLDTKGIAEAIKAGLGHKDKDTQSDGDGTTDKPNDKPGDNDAEKDAEGAAVALKDILQTVKEIAKNGDIPPEAKQRAGVVLTMLNDVSGKLAETMKTLAQAGKDMNIGGIAEAASEMVAGCYASLVRAHDELGRIGEAGELPEAVASALATASEGLGVITTALADLAGMKADAESTDDALPEGAAAQDENDNADADADPAAEAGADDYNDDVSGATGDTDPEAEDADEDDEEPGKADDDEERAEKEDDDAEEKAEDEDDTEEKANEVDGGAANPQATVDPEEDNPEVETGKAAGKTARKLLASLALGVKFSVGTLTALHTLTGDALKRAAAQAKKQAR